MLFGGDNGLTHLSRIAAFTPSTNKWTNEGNMQTGRYYHGVINVADDYVIIGGLMDGQQSSEKCSYMGNRIDCTYQNPTEPYGKHKLGLNFF